MRRLELSSVQPNEAHLKINELSKKFNVINFTTNVDDLLERAYNKQITHLHGYLNEVIYNFNDNNQQIVDIENFFVNDTTQGCVDKAYEMSAVNFF
jgi:hypothetical protein